MRHEGQWEGTLLHSCLQPPLRVLKLPAHALYWAVDILQRLSTCLAPALPIQIVMLPDNTALATRPPPTTAHGRYVMLSSLCKRVSPFAVAPGHGIGRDVAVGEHSAA